MSSIKKLIVVVGATGNQGSSVVRHFLTLSSWRVRAVTRNPSSSAAQSLASAGAEVVQADSADIKSLTAAFDGANAIFVNTDFWGTYRSLPATTEEEQEKNGEIALATEVEQGKNAAIVASSIPTLERYVYSALPPAKKTSKGKYYRSHHWDSKATVVEYIETELKTLAQKASFIYLGAYVTNGLVTPRLDPATGNYKAVIPFPKDVKMPIVLQSEATGQFVHALVENEKPGTKLLACNTYPTLAEAIEMWSQATGYTVDIVEISPEEMHIKSGLPWEVLEAAWFIPEYGYMGGVNGFIEPSQLKVPPKLRSYQDWVKEQDWESVSDLSTKEIESIRRQQS